MFSVSGKTGSGVKMPADAAPAAAATAPLSRLPSPKTNKQVLLKYYSDNDVFSSPEGFLKLLSVVVCVALAVVHLSGTGCNAAPALAAGSALVGAAAAAALLIGRALQAPLLAPQLWLYTDITVSASSGALQLVTGVLGLTLCDLAAPRDYVHGPLSICISVMLVSSAAITYSSAMRLWDAAAAPPTPRAASTELDV